MMDLEKLKKSCRKRVRTVYNAFRRQAAGFVPTDLPELNAIKERALERTSMNEHMETIFLEALQMQPRLIVELGVGGGESNFVLARVARLSGARLVSVDINDRSHVSQEPGWLFVHRDDIAFAREFPEFCRAQGFEPVINVLFIDTSHVYEHTVQEIEAYFPFLAPHAKVFFHDTNLTEVFYRQDGSMDLGWDNERGVIRALETYLKKSFNEKVPFVDFVRPWFIRHNPYCAGMTVLERLPVLEKTSLGAQPAP
jgi:predicted O-methyltransferase YrrM